MNAQQRRILLVEDDVELREALSDALTAEGHRVQAVGDGRQALQAMRSERPDVVVLDLMMPVMDGWTFRQRQLDIPEFADVPVICLTAVYDPQSASQALQAPCLHKPVEMDALLDRVERACWSDSSEA